MFIPVIIFINFPISAEGGNVYLYDNVYKFPHLYRGREMFISMIMFKKFPISTEGGVMFISMIMFTACLR